jgi:hypothetical protein
MGLRRIPTISSGRSRSRNRYEELFRLTVDLLHIHYGSLPIVMIPEVRPTVINWNQVAMTSGCAIDPAAGMI